MRARTSGIHHVTAIASDPQRNVDFYGGTLGLRMVKRTVNFDDLQTYHFYYGDGAGTPGSILTFFPWPRARAGRAGPGQVAVTSLAVPPEALGWWTERLRVRGVETEGPTRRFDGEVLAFRDPDGMMLELVTHADAATRPAWEGGTVPAEHAVRGVHSVTLWVDEPARTAPTLTEALGFRAAGEERGVLRFAAGDGGPGTLVDVRAARGVAAATGGAGTVHHVAWRADGDAHELALRGQVAAAGLEPTRVIDRNYFHSVYFREPGGVLYEIATDPPGFTADEPRESLGERLMLPPQFEPIRARLEAALPPIRLPRAVGQEA